MKLTSGVYEIVNVVNNHRYICSSINMFTRYKRHIRELSKGKHHSIYLYRAWKKYSQESFIFKPIIYCDNSMLLFYEQKFINYYRPEYNISLSASAPMAGRKHSKSSCEKMSIARLGNKYCLGHHPSLETREKISLAGLGNKNAIGNKNRLGKHNTAESKEKDRIAHLGNKYALGNKSMLGKHHTKETLLKMSLAQKGNKNALGAKRSDTTKIKIRVALQKYYKDKVVCQIRTPEHNENISKALRGRVLSEEHKKHISESKKLYWERMKRL